MSSPQPGWYDDGTGTGAKRWWNGEQWTDDVQPAAQGTGIGGMIDRIQAAAVSGGQPRPAAPSEEQSIPVASKSASYVVLQVILKEKLWGTGSGNLTELEKAINRQAALGYRLHTITTAASGSKGLAGGDRIQATMVFERLT